MSKKQKNVVLKHIDDLAEGALESTQSKQLQKR